MDKEKFESYLTLENIVALMTQINYRYHEKESIINYRDQLATKLDEISNFLKDKKIQLIEKKNEIDKTTDSLDVLETLTDNYLLENSKKNLIKKYKEDTKKLYEFTQEYNSVASSFNKMNGELKNLNESLRKKSTEFREIINSVQDLYRYIFNNEKYNNLIQTMENMDENNLLKKQKIKENKSSNVLENEKDYNIINLNKKQEDNIKQEQTNQEKQAIINQININNFSIKDKSENIQVLQNEIEELKKNNESLQQSLIAGNEGKTI